MADATLPSTPAGAAPDDTAYAWSVAFEKARDPGYGDVIAVPRSAEAALPPTMALRRSPPPYSLRRGATAVYRQDEAGEHYVIREYEDRWTVAVHEHNPHHAPLRHLASDVRFRDAVRAAASRLLRRGRRSRSRPTPVPEQP